MPESFVFDNADSLLGMLASFAYEEVSRAYGVYDDLQGIKDTLSIVRGLLLDAEEKKDKKHGLREWLRQIQNICSDAEDVLDGFELQDKRKQVVKDSGSSRMKTLYLSNCKELNLLSLFNESPVPRLRMKYLHFEGFPELLTLPSWIQGAADTLETLVIENFPNLQFISGLTKLPHLKRLYIHDCPCLTWFFIGSMPGVTALEDLRIDGCPELCRKCQPQSGECWPLISHIRHVFIGEPRGEED